MATVKSVNKLWIFLAIALAASILLMVGIYIGLMRDSNTAKATNYAECAKAKGAVLLETYPEQCVVDGKSFANSTQTAT